jgi:CRP/FNR family cyclic AMP-dependent transcriptional regulator
MPPMLSKAEVQRLLSEVSLFSGASKKELGEIASAIKVVDHSAGDVIAREGERGLGFFLVADGAADVTIGGQRKATLKRGDFFGEISLLDEGPRSATVTAATPLTLLGLTAWAFKDLVERHASIGLKMLEAVAARVRSATGDASTL